MKIIKRGELPQEKVYKETCSRCKSVLEFKHSELQWSPDPREPGAWFVVCPVCDNHVWGQTK